MAAVAVDSEIEAMYHTLEGEMVSIEVGYKHHLILKIVKAYWSDECNIIRLEHGGPLYLGCGVCSDCSYFIDSKNRVRCAGCYRFVKKCADISCIDCERYGDGEGDFVKVIQAVMCPICKDLVEYGDEYLDHLETKHEISIKEMPAPAESVTT